MSQPERLRIQRTDAPDLELRLVPFVGEPGCVLPNKTPAPHDVANAVLNSSNEWWVAFLQYLRTTNRGRHQSLLEAFVPVADIVSLNTRARGDVTLESLTEELDTIDHLLGIHGFDSTRASTELGGILQRLRKLELERGGLSAAAARVPELVAKIVRQRFELKRFNREAKARADGLRDAFKNGAITAVRRLHDHLDRQSPHWATERSVEGVKQFLSAWIEHDDESKKNPT